MSNFTEGNHLAVAKQWNWGLTKEGKQQVCVEFEIIEGPDLGKRISWFGYFTEKTMRRTLEALRYCGWRNDDIMDMEGMGDLQVSIVVEYEERTEGKNAGKSFPKVQWVNQPNTGVRLERPMDMATKRQFAAQLKLHARQVPIVTGPMAPSSSDRAKTEPVNHETPETDAPF